MFHDGLGSRNWFAARGIRGRPQRRKGPWIKFLVALCGHFFDEMELVVADVQHCKNDGHPRERRQHRANVVEQRSQDLKKRFPRHDQHQDANRITESHDGQNNFHRQPVEGEECGPDQVARLAVARRHQQRMPVLLEDFRQLVFTQRPAEFRLLVFHLRAQIFPQLFEDVLLL